MRFLNDEMRLVSAGSNKAAAEDFRDDLRGFGRAVDAIVRELIRGQALLVKRAEAGLITEERAAGHGHAAGKQNFERGIQPKNRSAGSAEEFRTAGLRVSAAAESEDGTFFVLGSSAECGAKLIGFRLAESRFAKALEDFGNGEADGFFDAFIEIDKAPCELAGEERSDGGLAGAHKSREAKQVHARLREAQRR
jgi:hypothetical protein